VIDEKNQLLIIMNYCGN